MDSDGNIVTQNSGNVTQKKPALDANFKIVRIPKFITKNA